MPLLATRRVNIYFGDVAYKMWFGERVDKEKFIDDDCWATSDRPRSIICNSRR
jgi:hypothetical protein